MVGGYWIFSWSDNIQFNNMKNKIGIVLLILFFAFATKPDVSDYRAATKQMISAFIDVNPDDFFYDLTGDIVFKKIAKIEVTNYFIFNAAHINGTYFAIGVFGKVIFLI